MHARVRRDRGAAQAAMSLARNEFFEKWRDGADTARRGQRVGNRAEHLRDRAETGCGNRTAGRGTILRTSPFPQRCNGGDEAMARGLLLWLIGIPLPIILLVWLLGGLN